MNSKLKFILWRSSSFYIHHNYFHYHHLSIIYYLSFHHSSRSYHFQFYVYTRVYTSAYLNYKFLRFHFSHFILWFYHSILFFSKKNLFFGYFQFLFCLSWFHYLNHGFCKPFLDESFSKKLFCFVFNFWKFLILFYIDKLCYVKKNSYFENKNFLLFYWLSLICVFITIIFHLF